MNPLPMPAGAARALVDAAVVVKAPDWPDTRAWQVVADGHVLVVVEPSYGGTSATGRNGWRWRLADAATPTSRPEPTRQQAAVRGLAAWERWATNKEAS